MQAISSTILLTGPSGSGKSTIAREIAKSRNGIVIDIENINYMFVNSFQENISSTGESILQFNDWEQAGKIIGMLAENFSESGRTTIVHGHVTKALIASIESKLRPVYKFLLLPTLESVLSRDRNRSSHMIMGESMIRSHYKYFTDNPFDGFVKIDSTYESINQTVSSINKNIP